VTLSVRELGDRSGRTVVLLHGGGGAGWMWEPQLEALSDVHVLVPDLPEHGQSRDAGPFSIESAARMLDELVRDRANGGRASVVGLSLGAQVALRWLALSTGRVDRALLSGTLVRPVFGASLARWSAKAYWPFKDAPWLVRANMKSLGIPPRFFEAFAAETRALELEAFVRITEENTRFRVPSGLDREGVAPALVLVGQRELSVMVRSARDLLAAMPRARGFVVDGASHNWSMETPERFNEVLRAWLEERALPEWLRPLA
jgi:pimeloyl-ACP methyl ester carboxylesterase